MRTSLRTANRQARFVDPQIAATAPVHGLTLVTRNVRDVDYEGLVVINPWEP